MSKPSYLNFDKAAYAWFSDVDYRSAPEKYHVEKGEQGVLICEPASIRILVGDLSDKEKDLECF